MDDIEEEFLTRYILSDCKISKPSVEMDRLLVASPAGSLDDFVYCVQKIGKMRRNAVLMRFRTSLKRDGGLDLMSSAIECDARHTLRYLAGVLKWFSTELGDEYFIVYKLLWPNHFTYAGALPVDHLQVLRADFKVAEHVCKLVLSRTFDVFCLPIRKLVDQVLQCQLDLTSSFELCITLESFLFSVLPHFSEESPLCVTFNELLPKVRSVLNYFLDRYCQELEKFPPCVLPDLSPPSAVVEGVSQLLAIIKVHDDVVYGRETPSLDSVILTMLNLILQICEEALMELKLDEAFGISSTDPGYALLSHALSTNVGSASSPQTDGASTIFLRNLVDAIILPLKRQRGSYSMDFAWNLGAILCSRLSCLTAAEAKAVMDRCGHRLFPRTPRWFKSTPEQKRKENANLHWRRQFRIFGFRPNLVL